MAIISQKTIDDIFSAARIEEVIGEFVSLKKRGTNYLALCPFHDEKTPSFNVSPTKEIYKCFGCGKSGNVVGFLMEHEKLTYPEALRYLAVKYQVAIEEQQLSPEETLEKDEVASIFIALNYAQVFYHNYLLNSEEGKVLGVAYLHNRGINTKTIEDFQLGFSPSERDRFTQEALKNGYKEKFLVEAGLSIKTEDGNLIDRFRERVMFPIYSQSGRVVGFGGRTLKSAGKEAKYINSPETKVYSKSNVLYGLNLAKEAIRKTDKCYLVEGYTDVIALHQAGVENVVASLGTSLTENHTKLIKRYTNNLIFIFDGDEAGIKASIRGIDIALKEDLNIKSIALPDKEDPDSFASKTPKTELLNYFESKSVDFIFFKSSLLLKDKSNDPIQKAEVIKSIIQSIALIKNRVNRGLYIKELSKKFDIEEEVLYSELNKQLVVNFKSTGEKSNFVKTVTELPRVHHQKSLSRFLTIEQEKEVMNLLLTSGKEPYEDERTIAMEIISRIGVTEWENPLYQKIYNMYFGYFEENGQAPDINVFKRHIDLEIQKIVIELEDIQEQPVSKNWDRKTGRGSVIIDLKRETNSALNHFELRKLQAMKKRNLKEIKNPELSEEEKEEVQKNDIFISERIIKITHELNIAYY